MIPRLVRHDFINQRDVSNKNDGLKKFRDRHEPLLGQTFGEELVDLQIPFRHFSLEKCQVNACGNRERSFVDLPFAQLLDDEDALQHAKQSPIGRYDCIGEAVLFGVMVELSH